MTELKGRYHLAVIFGGQVTITENHVASSLESSRVRGRVSEAEEILKRKLIDPADFNSPASHPLHVSVATALSEELASVLDELYPDDRVVAGYSLGMYPAITAAGVTPFEQMVGAVEIRQRIIATATKKLVGTTFKVEGSCEDLVEKVVVQLPEGWCIAAFNSPHSLNVTGPGAAADQAEAGLKEFGLEVKRLKIPLISHSEQLAPFMNGLSNRFLVPVTEYKEPAVPIINDVTGTPVVKFGTLFRKFLYQQLLKPVQWQKVIARLQRFGVERVIEVGIRPYLWWEIEKEWPQVQILRVSDPESLDTAVKTLRGE